MVYSSEELNLYSKKELQEIFEEEFSVEAKKSLTKEDLIDHIIQNQEDKELINYAKDNENLDETFINDNNILSNQRKIVEDDLDRIVESDEFKDMSLLTKIISPHITIKYIRKRLLNEEYDSRRGKSFRVDRKRPIVSKEFAGEIEALILSQFNPQTYIISTDTQEFNMLMRSNLIDFNDLLLNKREIRDDTYNTLYSIFRNLFLIGCKISHMGGFRNSLEKLNAGVYDKENFDENRNQRNPNLRDEAIGFIKS